MLKKGKGVVKRLKLSIGMIAAGLIPMAWNMSYLGQIFMMPTWLVTIGGIAIVIGGVSLLMGKKRVF